jgi:hypothetical protein
MLSAWILQRRSLEILTLDVARYLWVEELF